MASTAAPQGLFARFASVDALQANLHGWDARYDQIGPGPFSGSLQYCEIPDAQFSFVNWKEQVRFRGCGPQNAVCLAFPMETRSGPCRVNGTVLGSNDVVVHQTATSADYISCRNRENLVLSIPKPVAEEFVRNLSDEGEGGVECLNGVVSLPEVTLTEIRESARQVSAALAGYLKGSNSADLLEQTMKQALRLILYRVTEGFDTNARPSDPSKSAVLVARSEELLEKSENMRLGLADICTSLGVSLRTLHDAFEDATGVTAAKWLRIKRLNHLRRHLLTSSESRAPVRRAAVAHGFLHFGHFSAQYKQLFGELPSETLRL